MAKYQQWIEVTYRYLHEVDAPSIEEAEKLFLSNSSTCVDEEVIVDSTDIEEIQA